MKLTHSRQLAAAPDAVWKAFIDWGGVWQFQPWVVRSPLLAGESGAVGASRRCEFSDNTSIVETITKIVPGRKIAFALSEAPKPMKSGEGAINLAQRGAKTEVSVEMDVTLGMGPLNPLMSLMMKPVMRKRIDMMLRSLDHYLATGKKLDPKGMEIALPGAMPEAA